jgi:large subunit ribosomal protein L17
LQDKAAVAELFREVAAKVGERPGGYTRVIKLGKRLGDNADMAMMELVDFNELLLSEKSGVKAKATRRRRGSKTATTTTAPVAEKKAEAPKPEAPAEEEKSE